MNAPVLTVYRFRDNKIDFVPLPEDFEQVFEGKFDVFDSPNPDFHVFRKDVGQYSLFISIDKEKTVCTEKPVSFEEWKLVVDQWLVRTFGATSDCLPDQPYHDWYDDGVLAEYVPQRVLERVGII